MNSLFTFRIRFVIIINRNTKEAGTCERHIRPFSVARKVWLFCNTLSGAKATAILYTLVETAKANNSDPYYYLKYLLDSMPAHMDEHDRSFLADMMNGYRSNKTFVSSDCMALEFDNDHSEDPADWVRPEQVVSALPGVTVAVHYSRNHMRIKRGKPARPKFHLKREV